MPLKLDMKQKSAAAKINAKDINAILSMVHGK